MPRLPEHCSHLGARKKSTIRSVSKLATGLRVKHDAATVGETQITEMSSVANKDAEMLDEILTRSWLKRRLQQQDASATATQPWCESATPDSRSHRAHRRFRRASNFLRNTELILFALVQEVA